MQEWYAYSDAGSVTGKQLRVSQQNPAGQGYPANTGLVALTSSYVYDNEGKMTSVTYPSVSNYSATFTTSYDGMSRPSYLNDQGNDFIVNNVTYGPSNELLTMGYANCVGCTPYMENRTYNNRLQLTSINSLQYIYPNGANNGKASEQKVTGGEDVLYTYDALNRLIKAQTSNTSSTTWGQMFTYDGFGNLYQKTPTLGSAPAMTATVNAATNQLSLGSYDANGNLYTIPGTNGGSPTYFAIDVENRMVSVNTSGSPSGVATYWYGYDPGNRRVWKGTYSSNGTLTAQEAYFYSPTGQKLGTYSLTLNNYPVSNDVAVATDIQVFFGAKRVGHSEPGNPTIIGGVTQDRVGSFGSYYPYGEDKGTPLPNDQWKFATYTRDSASGLDYAMNRYYSSAWGRFGSPDVALSGGGGHLKNPQSFNQYAYAGGDPSNNVDPSGHDYFNPPFFYDDDLYGIFGPISVSPPPFGAILPAGVPSDWVAFGAYITALIDPQILAGVATLLAAQTGRASAPVQDKCHIEIRYSTIVLGGHTTKWNHTMLVGIDDSTGQTLGVIDGSPTPSALGDLAVLLLTPDVTANGTYNNANTSTPYLDTLSNSLNCLLWDLIVKEAENFPDALYGFSTSNSNSLTTYFWQQLGQSPVGPPPGPNTTPGWNDPILFYFPN